MTRKILYEKHKLEDFFYYHKKDDYTHRGFTFKKGEFYEIYMDEGGTTIVDDNNKMHDTFDMDRSKLSTY